MAIRLYDTLTRSIKPLVPRDPDLPYRMYCCGPTVYAPAHIGNFRTFLIQDILRRALETDGLSVRHARNITDVEDKTIRESQIEGIALSEFTARWKKKFHDDCAALNILPPHDEPSAVAHIPLQIAMIEKLIARRHAYTTPDGSVYFDISSYPAYGKLSHLDISQLRTQTAAPAATPTDVDEYERENLADFALWKSRKSADGPNYWQSPWGEGRPGWHIECTAMSTHYLGETFDLHGGGEDLCFPHHENEIAQAECSCSQKGFAAHWFHSRHLMVDGKKMSKSLNNFHTLDTLLQHGAPAMAIRYALICGHYRSRLNFTLKSLEDAQTALARLERATARLLSLCGLTETDFAPPNVSEKNTAWGIFQGAWDALTDDLNVPAALGKIYAALPVSTAPDRSLNQARSDLSGLGKILYTLGITLFSAKNTDTPPAQIPPDIAALAEQRWHAKQTRDFAAADLLRRQLSSLGWKIVDNKENYALEKL
ncbi:MAG: cysteine--tRNA ligase [Puniceicoccales bacterium]|jgi:cysteinyl-tRNA synthetase|nr:cysteine--tRNA ligase [Puniceicoccales bacterium]